jgi:hypothetical protein
MSILSIVLRIAIILVFLALAVVTVISTAPFGALAILAFRAGWIGTGLSVLLSIGLNFALLFWLMDRLRVQSNA